MAKLKIAAGQFVTVVRSADDEVIVVGAGDVRWMPDDGQRVAELTALPPGDEHPLADQPLRLFNAGIEDVWIDVLRSRLWFAHCENADVHADHDVWQSPPGTKLRAQRDRDDHVAASPDCQGRAQVDPA